MSREINASLGSTALRLANLSKTFNGGKALDDVSFDVQAGTVHALLGGNGSGKSTLVKSLAGVQAADAGGTITVGGATITTEAHSPAWARQHGLRFVHQNPGIFPTMTVADNLRMGLGFPHKLGRIQRRRLALQAGEILDRMHIDVSPNALMGSLRIADQTMVAIARALQRGEADAAISTLVLDEPTAALPEEEVEVLLSAIKRATESGIAIIYISHRLEEVRLISDAMTVLRDGKEIITRSTEGITEKELVAYIVGKPLTELTKRVAAADNTAAPVVAELRNVTGAPLRGVSLKVHEGEILGIAGLLGAGRSELLQVFFGDHKVEEGQVLIGGEELSLKSPAEAIKQGVAYIPEDRDTHAAFSDLTVRQNISAAGLNEFSQFGRLQHRKERQASRRSIVDFRIKTASDEALMSSLSGGNRQKVILARWMRRKPRLILLDEPTQGVDVGARADAYHLIRRAVSDGAAAILVSSDLEELAEMADRVLVLSNGRITAEIPGHQLSRHHLTEMVLTARKESA
jgi:ribose transport system ATP-binding protein